MMLRFRAMMSEGWCDPDGRNNDNGAHYFFSLALSRNPAAANTYHESRSAEISNRRER